MGGSSGEMLATWTLNVGEWWGVRTPKLQVVDAGLALKTDISQIILLPSSSPA